MAIYLTNVFNKLTQSLRVGKQSSFGEIGMYNLTNIFAYQSTWGISYQRDIINTTGSASVTNGNSVINIETGTTSESQSTVRTVARGEYQSGKSSEWGIAVKVEGTVEQDSFVDIGLFDQNNGYYYRIQNNQLNLRVLREGSVIFDIPLSEANKDKLDGKGASRVKWNLNEPYIYGGRFTWNGIGSLMFSLSVPTDKIFSEYIEAKIHSYKNQEFPSIIEPNLPITIRVNNGSTNNNINVKVAGRRYDILGDFVQDSRITGDIRINQTVGTTNLIPLISFRRKEIFPSNSSRQNSVNCFLNSFDIKTNNDLEVFLVSGDTLNGSFVNLSRYSPSETALKVNRTATTITNFTTLAGPFIVEGGPQKSKPELTSEKDLRILFRENDPMTLVARSISSSSSVTAAMRITETW